MRQLDAGVEVAQPMTRAIAWAAILALALALRTGFALGYWVEKPLTHDEHEYLALAENLAAGGGFQYPADSGSGQQRFGRAPLYPLFLAAILRVTEGADPVRVSSDQAPALARRLESIKIAQSIVGMLGVWAIGTIAARAAGARAGLIAAAMAAVYPPLVWICAFALSEALYSALALGLAVCLCGALSRQGATRSALDATRLRIRVVASGLLAGLATLTRPMTLLFFPLVAIWMLRQRRIALLLLLLAGAGMVIGPWTVRNLLVHRRFVLIASEGGVTFWTGNHPLSRGEGDLAANPSLKRADLALRQQYAGRTPEELEPIYYREALDYLVRHPFWWLGLLARKAFYFWVPVGPSYTLHSPLYYAATLASYGVLLPFGVAGFVRLRRTDSPPRALWLLALSVIVTALIFFPQERFRIPVIDPTLIVCAAAWFARRHARVT